ncbi:SDR family oxidoreductase [Glutamicibacter sp. NPDC087344]|uniref:SDR family oxidoreductase n=1 Tax=Glutamicibacter sp. NPDC087344 TaxID=3363994 RepID=UPI0037F3F013
MTDKPLVVLTGAAGGIGSAVAAKLRASGYEVCATDLSGENVLTADLTTEAGLADLESEIQARISAGSKLTGLVNVAGILHPGKLLDLQLEQWEQMQSVNSRSVFRITQLVARLMINQQSEDPQNTRGIVTVSSNAGRTPRYGLGGYCASKAASTMLTRCFSLELAAHGIRANVLSPGSTRTAMLASMNGEAEMIKKSVAGDPERFRNGIPLGRIADPEDIADSVEFLLSPKAKHLTGVELTADGGATI